MPAPPQGTVTARATIDIVSVTPLALRAGDADESEDIVDVQIRTGPAGPPKVVVIAARLANRPDDFSRAFEPQPIQGNGSLRTLPVKVRLADVPFAGIYSVTSKAVWDDTIGTAAEQDIQLSFVRPAGKVRVPTPLRIVRTAGRYQGCLGRTLPSPD
jgi:hypothetical protein